MDKLLGVIVALLIGLPLTLPIMLWMLFADAFVILKLWEWFAIPIGCPALPLKAFVGASLIIACTKSYKATPKEAVESQPMLMLYNVLNPWLLLGIGALARWWF